MGELCVERAMAFKNFTGDEREKEREAITQGTIGRCLPFTAHTKVSITATSPWLPSRFYKQEAPRQNQGVCSSDTTPMIGSWALYTRCVFETSHSLLVRFSNTRNVVILALGQTD